MSNVIHIEICKSEHKVGTWNMRIGDVSGSIGVYNMAKPGILDLISDEIKHLDNLKVSYKPVYTDEKIRNGDNTCSKSKNP